MRRIVIAGAAVLLACGGGDDGQRASAASSISIGSSLSMGEAGTGSGETADGTAGERLDLGVASDLAQDTDAECVAQMLEAELSYRPVDVLVVVDTSNSMANAIEAMEGSINGDFAAILEQSGLDYQVIVAADYPPAEQLSVCISMPLSGSDCNPPPPAPATTVHYLHYDAATGSGAFLDSVLAWATTADPGGYMPNGYAAALRPDAVKTIMAMTDGNSASDSTAAGDAFDAAMLALPGNPFGTVGDRQYTFHLFTSMDPNNPPSMPWGPADPLQGHGQSIQQVAVTTGGLRFPYTQIDDFDVVFQQIAMGVVESTPIECSFAIPEPPAGETIDPNTIEIDYLPGGVGPAESFHQVVGPADCSADAFYIDSEMIFLCPRRARWCRPTAPRSSTCATAATSASSRRAERTSRSVGIAGRGAVEATTVRTTPSSVVARYRSVRVCLRTAAIFVVGVLAGSSGAACGDDDREGEQTGQVCEVADECYPDVDDPTTLSGDRLCLDRVPGGYCTHLCDSDDDCCAVEGECSTDHPQVCAPFESTGMRMCFLSCETAVIGELEENDYCHRYANTGLGCRSTGGGGDNRKVCASGG